MKFKPPPKKKKVDPSVSSSPGVPSYENKDTGIRKSTGNANLRIQQARSYAVAEAQQDGCTGNFRIFDSPFANYLVPAIPTRAELGG